MQTLPSLITPCLLDFHIKDAIFGGESINERGTLERAARDGTLKREYKDVWKSTKQARKRCKRSDKQTCKRKGYCMEGEEDDFGEAEY